MVREGGRGMTVVVIRPMSFSEEMGELMRSEAGKSPTSSQ